MISTLACSKEKPVLQNQQTGLCLNSKVRTTPAIMSRLGFLQGHMTHPCLSSVAWFSGGAEKPQKVGGFIKSVEVEPVRFHICGKSRAAVDSAKKTINDLISKERFTSTIENKTIGSFSQADHQRLTDIQTTLNVRIMAGSQKGTPLLTIDGLNNDVFKATQEIREMLEKVREQEDLKVKMKLAGKVATWQYLQGNVFQNFDSTTNCELEVACLSNESSVNITLHGKLYTVNMPSGPAIDMQGNSLQIRRTDKGILHGFVCHEAIPDQVD